MLFLFHSQPSIEISSVVAPAVMLGQNFLSLRNLVLAVITNQKYNMLMCGK
ncbi:hypothetical protein QUB80_20395 [Chlorogloeopsis sp. ULAP01]|uniref:hypothetical protein n=1 Tax=Chlorogloeopsis sp. ULAP01 TaxID=3056483 RepID=UPI0025AAE95D|nr:hypothetical protein [Chlorogloeopsis sp. ULAP01]MDM9383058.1 hypothetical protein [Chlorogloeopsis sp. ULAP01]